MAARYVATPTAAIALTAATAKTVLMLIAGAAEGFSIRGIHVSIDVSTLLLIELVESTQATNGTAGTDFASGLKQVGGFKGADTTAPSQLACRHTYTSEPTVLTVLYAWDINGPGPFILQFPLEEGPESLLSGSTKYKGIGLRLTSTLASNCRVTLEAQID